MKKTNALLYLICISILFFSCLKEVKYNPELTEKKIVVNALCEVGSPMVVYLEKPVTFDNLNANDQLIVSGATIKVVNQNTGEEYVVTQPNVDNEYLIPLTVTENTTYTLEVSHPDYETVSSVMTVPPTVNLVSMDTLSYIEDGSPTMQGTFKFQDPIGENYYMIRVLSSYSDTSYTSTSSMFICKDQAVDNSLSSDIFGVPYGQHYYVFTDETFEGQLKTINTESYNPFFNLPEGSTAEMTYELQTLDRESYLYYKSLLVQSYSDPVLSEPAKLFTNIKNGFGIFASYARRTVVF